MVRLARDLGLISLVVGGILSAIPAPAQATETLTISATRITIDEGQRTSISGKGPAWTAGRSIRLQRKVKGGWDPVGRSRLSRSASYVFDVKPPRGWQEYRTIVSADGSHPRLISKTLVVRVKWTPLVTYTSSETKFEDTRYLRLDITVKKPPEHFTYLLLETREEDGTWAWDTLDEFVSDETPEATVQLRLPTGTVFRIKVPATGLSRAGYSSKKAFPYLPFELPLNSGISFFLSLSGQGVETVELELTQGHEASVAGDFGSTTSARLLDPEGNQLGGAISQGSPVLRVKPEFSGTYKLLVDTTNHGVLDLWASTPLEFSTSVDEVISVPTLLPGQGFDVDVTLTAGQAVTVDTDDFSNIWTSSDLFINSGGMAVAPLIPGGEEHSPVFRASDSGVYTYRYRPNNLGTSHQRDVSVLDANLHKIEVDDPVEHFSLANQRSVALFRYSPQVGYWQPTVNTNVRGSYNDLTTSAPLGELGGDRLLVVSGPSTQDLQMQLLSPLHLDYSLGDPLTEITPTWFVRRIVQHVALEAGDIVTGAGNGGGSLTSPDLVGVPTLNGVVPTWIVPADGIYFHSVYYHWLSYGFDTVVKGLVEAREITFPEDGTPTEFVIQQPDETVFARGTATPGSVVELELVADDAELNDRWSATLSQPGSSGNVLWPWTLTQQITVGPSGTYLVHVTGGDNLTGGVTLRQTVTAP